ncbi:hypothetical protein FQZ97_1055840 [compost metagenome]
MAMTVRTGEAGMPHPHVRIAPAGLIAGRPQGIAEQCPLRAPTAALLVFQVGGDVPPLDAVIRVGAVVQGKTERAVASHAGEIGGAAAEPGKPLGRGWLRVTGAEPGY